MQIDLKKMSKETGIPINKINNALNEKVNIDIMMQNAYLMTKVCISDREKSNSSKVDAKLLEWLFLASTIDEVNEVLMETPCDSDMEKQAIKKLAKFYTITRH